MIYWLNKDFLEKSRWFESQLKKLEEDILKVEALKNIFY